MATSLLLTDAPLASSILGVAVVVVSSKTPSEVIGDVVNDVNAYVLLSSLFEMKRQWLAHLHFL